MVSFLTRLVVEKPSTVGTISTRAALSEHQLVTDDGFEGVIAAFDEDVRAKGADELERGVFGEEDDGIDGGEGRT